MDRRRDLKSWYERSIKDLREFIRNIPTEPDRYQQRFYLSQAYLRFRDYWKARIEEEERERERRS